MGLLLRENSNSINMIELRKMTLVEDVTVVETPEKTELIIGRNFINLVQSGSSYQQSPFSWIGDFSRYQKFQGLRP